MLHIVLEQVHILLCTPQKVINQSRPTLKALSISIIYDSSSIQYHTEPSELARYLFGGTKYPCCSYTAYTKSSEVTYLGLHGTMINQHQFKVKIF